MTYEEYEAEAKRHLTEKRFEKARNSGEKER